MDQPYKISAWLLQKALAIIYFIAFLSFGVQASGLIGSGGLLPLGDFLKAAREAFGATAFLRVPTLLWLDSSDRMLTAVWVSGVIFSIAALLVPRFSLAACLVLYLSIVSAGQIFMSFQWDLLLLEAGFLILFVDGTRIRMWLAQWLLFRLLFLSGVVKLTSGDPTWRNLTALRYHYETQPLPTPVAWYMHQLPAAFQSFSVVMVFVAEMLAPVLLFAGPRVRPWAAAAIASFQILIALTGNYTFFNYLTIALCVCAIDNAWWPERVRKLVAARTDRRFRFSHPHLHRYASVALLIVIVPVSLLVAAQGIGLGYTLPATASRALERLSPFGIVNAYGLFANMTTSRPEIIVEASMDGSDWREYEFRFKPGDVKREPAFVAPYQPRLDWQMWFAALGSYRENPFFVNLMIRLLEARPEVLRLLGRAPFGAARPRYVRAQVYNYKFTDWATLARTGAWWTREPLGSYFPAVGAR